LIFGVVGRHNNGAGRCACGFRKCAVTRHPETRFVIRGTLERNDRERHSELHGQLQHDTLVLPRRASHAVIDVRERHVNSHSLSASM
jgi:hypothetical protein